MTAAGAGNRRRHCLLSAGALLLGLVGAAIVLPWWGQMQRYDERVVGLTERLASFRALSARRPLLESPLQQVRPLLFVDNLSIRSRKRVKGRRKNRTVEYRLDDRFDLSGYLREDAK